MLRDPGGQSKEGQDILKGVGVSQGGARMVSELCQQREAAEVASDGGSDSGRRGCTGARRTVPSGALRVGRGGTGRDWATTHRLGHQEVHQPPGSRRGGRLAGQDGNSL